MKLISKLALLVIANTFALYAASRLISGFTITEDFKQLIALAALFTLINVFLKPVLKLVLSPVIILTLGAGILLVNALLLWILDFLSKDLTIETILTLIYATLLVSAVNIIVHLSTKY